MGRWAPVWVGGGILLLAIAAAVYSAAVAPTPDTYTEEERAADAAAADTRKTERVGAVTGVIGTGLGILALLLL